MLKKLVVLLLLTAVPALAGGPPAGHGQRGQCVKQCAHAARDARQVENDQYELNLEACAGDSLCEDLEDSRHADALRAIKAESKACKAACKN